MASPPVNLGYGSPTEANIDHVNQWMRSQPWYQSLIRSFGQDPANVHLTDNQKSAVVRAAQSNGVIVDEGKQEVDDSGNFRNQGHGLRNTLLVAGIAGAALATMGAAGVFGGAAAGAGAGAGASATAAGAGAAGAAGAGGAAAGLFGVPASTLFTTGASLFGNLFAAHEQIGAANDAASQQAAAAKYSADLQAKAQADALAFSKGSAENAFLNNEAARQGNYGIFAARERRLGTIGQEVGLGAREIPGYVAGVDPHYDGSSGAPAGPGGSVGAPASPAGVDPTKGDIGGQISAYFKSRGVSDQETPYWVQKWGEFGAKDPGYFNRRLAAADVFGRGGGGSAQPVGMFQPYRSAQTPLMNVVQPAQIPGALGSYS